MTDQKCQAEGKARPWKARALLCAATAMLVAALWQLQPILSPPIEPGAAEPSQSARGTLPAQALESLRFLSSKATPVKHEVHFIPLADPRAVIAGQYGWRVNPLTGIGMEFHNGLDIAAPKGTEVLAWDDGVVVQALNDRFTGLTLKIAHAGSLSTTYAHMDRVLKNTGDAVRRGDVIGEVGYTGRSTGPHLHLGIEKDGVAVDPLPYVWEQAVDRLAERHEPLKSRRAL